MHSLFPAQKQTWQYFFLIVQWNIFADRLLEWDNYKSNYINHMLIYLPEQTT